MQVVRIVSFGGDQMGSDLPPQLQQQLQMLQQVLIGEEEEDGDETEEDDKPESEKIQLEENVKIGHEEKQEEDVQQDEKAEEQAVDSEINPRVKVLQKHEEEKQGHQLDASIKKLEDQVESLKKGLDTAEFEVEVQKPKENAVDSDTRTKKPDETTKVKIKVLDVQPSHENLDSNTEDDYDVVHSKTRRIKIEGIPNQAKRAKDPPKSVFRNLGPSDKRYTLLRDELWYSSAFTPDFIAHWW